MEESENNTRAAFERLVSRRGHLLTQNDGASTAWLLVMLYEKLISTDDGDKILLGECKASHTATAQLIVKRDVQRFLVTLLNQANEVCNACSLDESERLRASQQASEELISGHFNICGPRLHNLRRLYSDCHSAYQRKANEGIDIEMRAQLLEDEVLDDNISCNTREARVQKYRSMPKESTKRLRHIAETLGTLWVRMNAVLPREMLVPLRRPFRGLPADHQLVSQSHGKAADSPPSEYHPMKLEVVGPFFVQPSTAVIDLTDDGESGDSLTISENSGSPLSRLEGEPVREQRVIFLPEDSQVHRVGDILYTKECTEDDEPHFFQCHVKDVLLNNAFRVVYDDDKEDVVESKFLFTDDQMKADLEDQDMENLCQCVVM